MRLSDRLSATSSLIQKIAQLELSKSNPEFVLPVERPFQPLDRLLQALSFSRIDPATMELVLQSWSCWHGRHKSDLRLGAVRQRAHRRMPYEADGACTVLYNSQPEPSSWWWICDWP